MLDSRKTKEELIKELNALRNRVAQLEPAGGKKEYEESDESEQTFRMFFHNAFDGMFLADTESKKFHMANAAICQTLGYTPEEMIELGVMDIHPAKDLPDLIDQFDKQVRGEISLARDIPVKRKDGSVFHADISACETILSGRSYLMGVFRDVTDRKNARERDETILKTCIDGFWLVETDGQILEVNDAYCRMSGYSRDELLTMSIDDVEAGETPQEIAQQIRKIVDRGALRFESRHRRKNGTIMDLDISAHYLGLDGGRVFAFFRDITDRKRAEQRQALRLDILEVFHQQESLKDICARIISLMKVYFNCEAVGLRMKEGDDYPYFVNDGFPPEFIESQNYLCSRDKKGNYLRDSDGNPVPACMCRLIIEGKFDKDNPFFTTKGNFWTNSTTSLLASAITENGEGAICSICNRHGYESVALIRVEADGDRIGLLQVNAKRKNLFSERSLQFLEELGQLVGIAAERRKAELALQQSEEKFRRIAEQGFDVVLTADPDGTLIYASPSAKRVFGYRPEEMIGKNAAQFASELSVPNLIQQFKETTEGKSFEGLEVEICRKDGSIAVIELNFAPLYDGETLIGAQASARDITERRRATRALRESEEKYRTLVESAGESIASIDENGVFLFINTTCAERFGGKPEDYVGKTMWDVFPKIYADRHMTSIHKVMEQGHGMTYTSLTELRGQLRWHNTTIEPLRAGDSGKIASVIVLARDINDMKQAEEELARYRERMAHTDLLASLGTLSATVAHELTQPLTVIRLSLDNLLDELKAASSPETLTRKLENSLAEVSNLTTIIDRFRNFARKSSEPAVGEIDLQAVAEKIVTLLAASARRARVALHLRDMDGLPLVHVNERDFEQLFFALVQNAIQAADGKKARELVISGSVKDGYVELCFADDCGGIAPENLDAVLEPFFTTKPAGQGTGLGLCIVREIASRAGGKLSIESEFGKGSTFFITLPIDEDRIAGSNNGR